MWHTPKAKFHFDNIYENSPITYGHIKLFQIGELVCDSGYLGGMHQQKVFEISYIMDGKGKTIINGKEYAVQKGNVILNKIGDAHEMISSDEQPMRFFYIGFDFDDGAKDDPIFVLLMDFFRQSTKNVAVDFFNIGKYFLDLFYEITKSDSFTDRLIELYINQIMIMTNRAFQYQMRSAVSYDMFKSDVPLFIYDVMNFIQNEGYMVGKLENISNELNYSYHYISREFSKAMGESMKGYSEKCRFEKALEYMRDDYNSSSVAKMLGYNNVQAFSKAFKNYYGISPTEYIARTAVEE